MAVHLHDCCLCNAGNKSAEVSFEPLGLEVTPVTAITNTTAHIEAQVIQGTNPLSKSLCYIEYKKATETSYDTVLVNKTGYCKRN